MRDYGFGAPNPDNQVTLDGESLTIISWTDSEIVVSIPAGSTTGTLMVTRGDTGIATEIGLTLNVVDCSTTQIIRVPGNFPTIQQAIDAAVYTPDAPGALILVAPGTYNENVIMYKPVRLQGAGAGSTFINGNPTPISKAGRLACAHRTAGCPQAVSTGSSSRISCSKTPSRRTRRR